MGHRVALPWRLAASRRGNSCCAWLSTMPTGRHTPGQARAHSGSRSIAQHTGGLRAVSPCRKAPIAAYESGMFPPESGPMVSSNLPLRHHQQGPAARARPLIVHRTQVPDGRQGQQVRPLILATDPGAAGSCRCSALDNACAHCAVQLSRTSTKQARKHASSIVRHLSALSPPPLQLCPRPQRRCRDGVRPVLQRQHPTAPGPCTSGARCPDAPQQQRAPGSQWDLELAGNGQLHLQVAPTATDAS